MPSASATILVSRGSNGASPSAQLGNVSWSEDGQCLYLTKRGVTIITPYLGTALSSPQTLLNEQEPESEAKAKTGEGGNESEDEAAGTDAAGGGGNEGPASLRSQLNVRRPKQGELKFWTTGVEVGQGQGSERGEVYGLDGVEDEMNITLRTDELYPRMAVWSPSGMSDIGGCMLAILSSRMQVSIYTPRGDPLTKQWEEISDLTYLTRNLLEDPIGIPELKRLQTSYLAWSSATSLPSQLGFDSSLLATADRAGGVSLWSYGSKAHYTREAYISVRKIGWVSVMSWSSWSRVDENTARAQLAVATTDGVITLLPVEQCFDPSRNVSVKVGVARQISEDDRRTITAVRWVEDILVWCKPGSVHLWAEKSDHIQWEGVRNLRLERIGNWAGANALATCVGIAKLREASILLTLASYTAHVIKDIYTSPALVPAADNLTSNLAARHAFLDYAYGGYWKRNRYRVGPLDERSLTAHTGGLAAIGDAGLVASLTSVLMNHNLDVQMEAVKTINFSIVDLGASLFEERDRLASLKEILASPPSVLRSSPLHTLSPFMLSLMTQPPDNQAAQNLVALCHPHETIREHSAGEERPLLQALFDNAHLNASRLKYVLASWCARTLPDSNQSFSDAAERNHQIVRSSVLSIVLREISRPSSTEQIRPGSQDATFVRLSLQMARSAGCPEADVSAVGSALASGSIDRTGEHEREHLDTCRACGEAVALGENGVASCPKGHEWARCSITHMLITTPIYRTCMSCTAIALLPTRIIPPPVPVTPQGAARDHERFREQPAASSVAKTNGTAAIGKENVSVKGDGLIQAVLEACKVCPTCGGRWMRAI